MRMHMKLFRLVILGATSLFTLAALAGSTLPGSTGVAQAQEEPEPQYRPCGVEAKRTVDPLVVQEGEVVNVKVTYEYNCIGGTKKINFILLVEATISEQNIVDRGGLLQNLKIGLSNFVNKTNFTNGTTGGLTLIGDTYQNRVPLRGDREGKQDLLTAIELISIKPISGAVAWGSAIVDAVGRLPTNVEDANENWIIMFDRGAQEVIDGTVPPVTAAEGCARARRTGVNVAVISHQDAQNRYAGCATRGYYRQSSGARAPDLPQIYDELADAIVRGKQAKDTIYQDYAFNDSFEFVQGSGRPRDPDDQRGQPPYDIGWRNKDSQKPPGGYVIDYQWRALTGLPDPITPISVDDFPTILFQWADGSFDEYTLDDPVNNPEICVYRPGRRQQDCGNHGVPTAVPTAPIPETPTPTATPVPPTTPPTAVVPTNTPVPTQTPLPGLYLPALLREGNLGD